MPFLDNPRPERVFRMALDESLKVFDMLSIGAQVITKDPRGLDLIPHTQIVFAFGDGDDPEKRVFGVPISMARDVAKRIVEMCDELEKSNAPGTQRKS